MKRKIIISIILLFLVIATFNAYKTRSSLELVALQIEEQNIHIEVLDSASEQRYKAVETYNDLVKEYNILVRRFPNFIYASMFGYDIEDYYYERKIKEPKRPLPRTS